MAASLTQEGVARVRRRASWGVSSRPIRPTSSRTQGCWKVRSEPTPRDSSSRAVRCNTESPALRAAHVSSRPTRRKSGVFLKLEQLAARVAALSPLGEGVVIPAGGAITSVPWAEWRREGAGAVFGAFVTLRRAGAEMVTRGLSLFSIRSLAPPLREQRSAVPQPVRCGLRGRLARPLPRQRGRPHGLRHPEAGSWRLRPAWRATGSGWSAPTRHADFTLHTRRLAVRVAPLRRPRRTRGPRHCRVRARRATLRGIHNRAAPARARSGARGALGDVAPPQRRGCVRFAAGGRDAECRAGRRAGESSHHDADARTCRARRSRVVEDGGGRLDASGTPGQHPRSASITPAELADFGAGGQGDWMEAHASKPRRAFRACTRAGAAWSSRSCEPAAQPSVL